jgi:hypothetical protein
LPRRKAYLLGRNPAFVLHVIQLKRSFVLLVLPILLASMASGGFLTSKYLRTKIPGRMITLFLSLFSTPLLLWLDFL